MKKGLFAGAMALTFIVGSAVPSVVYANFGKPISSYTIFEWAQVLLPDGSILEGEINFYNLENKHELIHLEINRQDIYTHLSNVWMYPKKPAKKKG